jgi:hypothetical protein
MAYIKLKAFLFTSALLLGTLNVQAQTYAEFFRQKKTQKKYLLEQLVALKVYAGYLKKGYDIASTGLNMVRDFSKGEFSLHNSFISSLKAVSPVVKNNSKVADIIILQLEISKAFRNINFGNITSANTQAYVGEVKAKVMEECDNDIDELLLVITSGKVEMKDDERLKRLEKIYLNMLDKSAFVQSFCNQVNMMKEQRTREQQSINQLKQLYETN